MNGLNVICWVFVTDIGCADLQNNRRHGVPDVWGLIVIRIFIQSPRFKKFGKIWLSSKLSLGLIYDLSFRIPAAFYFPQSWVQKTGLWRIFMVGIGAFRVFMRTKHNIEPYSPVKPTKVGFIFIGPKIVQLSITWYKMSLFGLGRRLGLKVGFKELRIDPNFLNLGLKRNSVVELSSECIL